MRARPIDYTVQFPDGELARIAYEGHLQAGDTFPYEGKEWRVTQAEARPDGPFVAVVESTGG